jgi:hypothetical protein
VAFFAMPSLAISVTRPDLFCQRWDRQIPATFGLGRLSA